MKILRDENRRHRSLSQSQDVATPRPPPLPSSPVSRGRGLSVSQPPPCQPQQQQGLHTKSGSENGYINSVGGLLPSTQVSTSPPCLPQNTPSLVGTNTVIISLAFIVSAVSIVCAANKWYEFLFSYSSPALGEYRERQERFEEREQARRRAASAATVTAAAEAAQRRRGEELYSSLASASTSYDHGHLQYGSESSSSSSSPEIHPASPSSSSRSSFGSARADQVHFSRHMIFAAQLDTDLHSSRWQR